MRWLRVLLTLLVWQGALLLGLASTGAALLAQGGRVSLKLDVLTHFAPFFLVGALVALLVGLAFRGRWRWSLAIVGLVGIAAAGALMLPEFVRDVGPQAQAKPASTLKIVQFNVWQDNKDPEAILAWLDREQPDIAVIEENSPAFTRALAVHGGWHVDCRRCDVLMLSRHGAVTAQPGRRTADGRVVPLTTATFRDGQGPFEVIGVHNGWPTDKDQAMQEARLLETVRAAPDRRRLIITGDFNSTPWSFARRRWDAAFGIPRRERAVASWPARRGGKLATVMRWPFLPIDHIYAGPGWATVEVHRGPRLSSDHFPLVVTLAPIAAP